MQKLEFAGVISLPGSEARLAIAREGAPRSLVLVPGVNGRSLGEQGRRARFDVDGAAARYGRPLTPGEVGCTLAHLTALRTFLGATQGRPGDTLGLICEDDVRFGEGASDWLVDVMAAHRHELTFLVPLGEYGAGETAPVGSCGSAEVVRQAPLLRGAGAYLVSRDAARVIVDAGKPYWIADDYLWFRERGLDVLTVERGPIGLQDVTSTIDAEAEDRLAAFRDVKPIRTRWRGSKSFLTRFGTVRPERMARWHRQAAAYARLPFAVRTTAAGRAAAVAINDAATGHTLPQRVRARLGG